MSRSRDTPGRKLIEDLLAKNVAKYAAEDEINNKNKEISDGKKRKTSSDDFKKKKKKKNRHVEQKVGYDPDLNFSSRKDDFKFAIKNEKKVENLEYKYTDVKVEGYEYTEIEVETNYLLQHTKSKPIELDKEVDDTESVQVEIKVEDAENEFQDVANEIKCKLKRNKKKRKSPTILNLLAKSVAKIKAGEAEHEIGDRNKETFGEKQNGEKRRKPIHKGKSSKNHDSSAKTDHVKCELKTEDFKLVEVKSDGKEYTEIKTEIALNDKENVVVNVDIPETKPTYIELNRLQEEVKVKVTKIEVKREVKKEEGNINSKMPRELNIKNGKRNNQLILDLLAKSLAKVNADEAEIEDNKYLESFGGKKRKHLEEKKKKKKTELESKSFRNCDSLVETNHFKCEPKTELKTEYIEFTNVKRERHEYTGINKDDTDVKINFMDTKPTKIKLKQEIDTDDLRSFPVKVKMEDTKFVTKETKCQVNNNIENNVSKLTRESKVRNKNRMNLDKNKETTQVPDLEANSILRRRKQKKVGHKRISFTAEEDRILLQAIEQFGDKINIGKLEKQLNRRYAGITRRIENLKNNKVSRDRRGFTLMEDLTIMDAVLVQLPEQSLEMIDLSYAEWNCIGAPLGRDKSCLDQRWKFYLKPWLLQFFSGTLNLDIRRMLANYLAEHFEDIDSVDWSAVASKPKFVGHTLISLRNIFFKNLFKFTKKSKGGNSEVTLKDVADCTNAKYKFVGLCTVQKNILRRQKEIIDYFEQYVKKQGIEMFDVYSK
eukprot:GFUD01037272.1.p1 GENE.GFUD01037272.1~~GFUD01037272.1.p1  ORF type:complete len:770 (-),score=230.53 GFUD01037272.1:155-2464(-)